MESGSRRVEVRGYPLSSEISRTSLPATGPRLLPTLFPRLRFLPQCQRSRHPSLHDPLFNDLIHPFSKRFPTNLWISTSIRGYLSSVFVKCRRESFSPFSFFFFYFKSLYHRRRDEAWLDLDGIPGRQRWRMGKGRKKGGHSRIWVGTVSVKGATRYASFSSSPPFIARGDRIPLRYLNGRHPSPLPFHYPNFTLVPKFSVDSEGREYSLFPSFSFQNPRLKKNFWTLRDRIRVIATSHFLFARTTTDRSPRSQSNVVLGH